MEKKGLWNNRKTARLKAACASSQSRKTADTPVSFFINSMKIWRGSRRAGENLQRSHQREKRDAGKTGGAKKTETHGDRGKCKAREFDN